MAENSAFQEVKIEVRNTSGLTVCLSVSQTWVKSRSLVSLQGRILYTVCYCLFWRALSDTSTYIRNF